VVTLYDLSEILFPYRVTRIKPDFNRFRNNKRNKEKNFKEKLNKEIEKEIKQNKNTEKKISLMA